MMSILYVLASGLLSLSSPTSLPSPMQDATAQAAKPPAEVMKELYAKREVKIPMRDGVKLFTSIYSPRDTSQRWPILLRRTPYSVRPYGADNYPDSLGPSRLFPRGSSTRRSRSSRRRAC